MQAFSPALQRTIDGQFHVATPAEVDQALELATTAFVTYRQKSGADRARFLRAIAEHILKLGDDLIARAMKESGLPEKRLIGERGRTVNQLRLFADLIEEGSWVDARIDRAQPDRQPVPKSDIRRMLRPLGPVVVFTASNFPLAFSTAGGDTASALAAGCPVVIKAHESHLGTNALVALAIHNAALETGMPDGVFSSLNGSGPELGQQLVRHPAVKAIAFTGSLAAGKAIYAAAAQRLEPIPVFAEMGSVNPVFLLPEALHKRGVAIATQYAGSVTLGVGQFCTNPGLLIGIEGPDLDAFSAQLAEEMAKIPPATMLNEKVCEHFRTNKDRLLEQSGVSLLSEAPAESDKLSGEATVASVSGTDFLANAQLSEEVFGPLTLLVRCRDRVEFETIAQRMPGQLTATIMGETAELTHYDTMIEQLQQSVGRLIFNGVPTGVEVCAAMQHGGPFPATTDARFTSVGTDAIRRFARPVAFQDMPETLLPLELKNDNPLGIWRLLDGELTKP